MFRFLFWLYIVTAGPSTLLLAGQAVAQLVFGYVPRTDWIETSTDPQSGVRLWQRCYLELAGGRAPFSTMGDDDPFTNMYMAGANVWCLAPSGLTRLYAPLYEFVTRELPALIPL